MTLAETNQLDLAEWPQDVPAWQRTLRRCHLTEVSGPVSDVRFSEEEQSAW
ncbi:hypothetical protein GCM10022631_02740 [Deinococcus rubellus]|uniref:hypothetical protein n=1 Tax=Deinococcus rubellus TaxID=1889240 RepID=UPI0031EE92F7